MNETLQLPQARPYLAIDLFAGCGGLSLGFECAGVKTIGYEMKPECCETYRANLHSECRNEMLTEETEYPQADVILGGPPCQPFSRRGKRKGKDDARDGFPAYIAAIRKVQPKIWVCENVKGLPELDEKYFKSILRPRDLRLDEPARTLTCRNLAGCTSDMHRIRLEDGRRRRLSVREAARLQSFPDWYEFSGTKEQQFTMIGNAVPPMFSYKLAQSVISYLKWAKTPRGLLVICR